MLLTIQVDSVSKIHENDAVIPANVAQAANFYQPNGFSTASPRFVPPIPAAPGSSGIFDSITQASPYNCEQYPWYDRVFVKSHTQIECDPTVWKQAEALIRSELPPTTASETEP